MTSPSARPLARLVILLLSVCLLAWPGPRPASAETVDQLQARIDQITALTNSAGGKLLSGDRAGAVGDLQAIGTALDDLEAAAAASQADLGASRKKLIALLKRTSAKLAAALKKTNDAAQQPWNAQKAIANAQAAALAAGVFLQRTQALGVTLQEVNARSAGFHDPQKNVLFKIQKGRDELGNPCDEPPTIQVIDVSGAGAVSPDWVLLRQDRHGNQVISVALGAAGGAGRVEVTACGVTRRWLLFNYGPRSAYPVLPKPDVDRFDGEYFGNYNGTIHAQGRTEPTGGGVHFTVSHGRITIDDPGTGVGRLASSGRARFAGGSGGAYGARYTFSGTLTEFVVGGVGGGGGWHATFQGGSANGTWNAVR